jgi:hypothetical protein
MFNLLLTCKKYYTYKNMLIMHTDNECKTMAEIINNNSNINEKVIMDTKTGIGTMIFYYYKFMRDPYKSSLKYINTPYEINIIVNFINYCIKKSRLNYNQNKIFSYIFKISYNLHIELLNIRTDSIEEENNVKKNGDRCIVYTI